MSTETDDQPADAGVAAEANAPTDDHSTEAFDRMEAPEDDADDDAAAGETGEGDDDASDEDKAKAAAEDPDSEEIELSDGRKVRVPKEVALARLRHDDYTRKTQDVAAQARELETDRQTWEAEREASRAALPEEHKRVAVLSHSIGEVESTLSEFDKIDWVSFRAQALTEGGEKAELYNDYRARFNAARDTLTDLKDELGKASNDLKAKDDQRLHSQREANQASLAKAQEDTGRVLAQRIEGWGPQKAHDVIAYAQQSYGVQPAEMAEATDARVWLALHDAMTARAALAKAQDALKKHQTASKNSKDQATTPAVVAKGSGGQARDPSTPRGDGLSTKEWMDRRNRQKAKA